MTSNTQSHRSPPLRTQNLTRMSEEPFDVLVIGGGINGAVSGAALASKGAKVALVELGDFASGTSQESSNLAWGGIKYLESYEFSLVAKLCSSRNQLLRSYPSTVQEIRFLTSVPKGFRHNPLSLQAGTWLYWLMGRCFTQAPRTLSRARLARDVPVVNGDEVAGLVEYSDAYLYDNDARFVFGFIRTALDRGCAAANYVEALDSTWHDNGWTTRMRDDVTGDEFAVRSKAIINATGGFVDRTNAQNAITTPHHHAFSKGIHLIVDRITDAKRVLAFFADDGRLFFAIPMGSRTCLGTTDTRVSEPTAEVTDEDRHFVLDNINRRLNLERPISVDDIIAERCGVRPLAVAKNSSEDVDFLQMSRGHAIDVDAERAHISIFGGKITDCINVGEEVVKLIRELNISLPYPDYQWFGEPDGSVREEFFHRAKLMNLDALTGTHCTEPLSTRLWRRYGTHALALAERVREDPAQADILIEGTEYIRCEIDQAAHREMIVKLEDFLRRRSKIALVMKNADINAAPGLTTACEILFQDSAAAARDEYFSRH
jgi:glycerol-3-phosphate dehydrogenase